MMIQFLLLLLLGSKRRVFVDAHAKQINSCPYEENGVQGIRIFIHHDHNTGPSEPEGFGQLYIDNVARYPDGLAMGYINPDDLPGCIGPVGLDACCFAAEPDIEGECAYTGVCLGVGFGPFAENWVYFDQPLEELVCGENYSWTVDEVDQEGENCLQCEELDEMGFPLPNPTGIDELSGLCLTYCGNGDPVGPNLYHQGIKLSNEESTIVHYYHDCSPTSSPSPPVPSPSPSTLPSSSPTNLPSGSPSLAPGECDGCVFMKQAGEVVRSFLDANDNHCGMSMQSMEIKGRSGNCNGDGGVPATQCSEEPCKMTVTIRVRLGNNPECVDKCQLNVYDDQSALIVASNYLGRRLRTKAGVRTSKIELHERTMTAVKEEQVELDKTTTTTLEEPKPQEWTTFSINKQIPCECASHRLKAIFSCGSDKDIDFCSIIQTSIYTCSECVKYPMDMYG